MCEEIRNEGNSVNLDITKIVKYVATASVCIVGIIFISGSINKLYKIYKKQ